MKRFPTSSSLLLAALTLSWGLACSSEGDGDGNDGGGGENSGSGGSSSGGANPGSGGGTGSGGDTNGSGGDTNGSGGAPGGAAFECPAGSADLVLDLTGKTVSLVAAAPDIPGIEGGGQHFLEGPVWVDGSLYVSQLRGYGSLPPARILKLEGSTLTEFIADSGTNGLAVRGDGKIVAASHKPQDAAQTPQKARGIVVFDPASPAAAPTVLADEYQGSSFNSPNDLVLADNGHVYFTDPNYQCGEGSPNCGQGTRRVYQVAPGGAVTAIPTDHNQPNGIALSPDGATLYVAGSGPIAKYTVDTQTGAVGAASQFANVSGVDGLTVDCAGNVYATVHSDSRVEVLSSSGESLGSLAVGQNVTNVAFGGPDHTTLYITTYGGSSLYSVELNVPGYPY